VWRSQRFALHIHTLTTASIDLKNGPIQPPRPHSWEWMISWGTPLILRRVYDQTLGPPQADHSRGACPHGDEERESNPFPGGPCSVMAAKPTVAAFQTMAINPLTPKLGG
jgi:hypothetical protein